MTLRSLLLVFVVLTATGCGTPPPPPACNASNGLGCCDASGVCNPGTLPNACGFSGNQCAVCSQGLACTSGLCAVGATGGGGGGSEMTGGGGGTMTGGGGGNAMTGGGGGNAMTGGGGGNAMTGGGGGGEMTGGGGGNAMTGGGGGAMTGGGGGAMTGGGGGAMIGGGGGAMTGGGGAMTGGGAGGGAMTGGGSGTAGTGETCSSPRILLPGMQVSSTTANGGSKFSFPEMSGCLPSSGAPDVVYQLEVPPSSGARVVATAAWDMVLTAVRAPVSNCGSLAAGTTVGATCDRASDDTTGNESLSLINDGPTLATWFIIIDGYSASDSGSYTLSATVTTRPAGPMEIEPNDTRVLADATNQALSIGAPLNAVLGVNEADVFRVNVPNAGVLRLDVGALDCDTIGATRLSLLDAQANQLHVESVRSGTSCRVLVAQVQQGTYYVALARSIAGAQPAAYWITPTLLTAPATESEPNETGNQANLLSGTDVVICGALGSGTTDLSDTFLVTLSQPATLQAEVIERSTTSLLCESDLLDSRLQLLSGAGLPLVTDTISGRGSCSRLSSNGALQPGTYLLQVTEASSFSRSGFEYCLVVRLR